MREIEETRNQNRRDFTADYECEGCGNIDKKISGYDDYNFHLNVVPNIRCSKCGETTVTLDEEIVDRTKVPAGVVI